MTVARNERVSGAALPGAPTDLAGPAPSWVQSFSCKLDVPPSANHMHTVANGRKIKSAEYRTWLLAAAWEVSIAHKGHLVFIAPVTVAIDIPKKHALSDLDNRIKPIIDALQNGGAIENDNLVHRIEARWRPDTYADQERVWVTVSAL